MFAGPLDARGDLYDQDGFDFSGGIVLNTLSSSYRTSMGFGGHACSGGVFDGASIWLLKRSAAAAVRNVSDGGDGSSPKA